MTPPMHTVVAAAVAAGAALLGAAPSATASSVIPAPSTSVAGAGSTASAGCGTTPGQAPGSSTTRTLLSGGLERSYVVHLPQGYDPHRRSPVVLTYHGRGNTGAGTQAFAGLDSLPAIVVYPDGVVGTGSGQRQAWEGAPYSAPGVDDVQFTSDLLDRLEADLCVDPRRVYATGKSNGGGLVGLLGCELSDRIAAIAPVAAAHYAVGHPACEPVRPVPVLAFHGTGDTTIPYAGDADRGLPAITDWTRSWADRNGCRGTTTTRPLTTDVEVTRWRGCRRGADTALVSVLGGGHTWPGADSYSGGGYTTPTEAAELMWAFFRHHRLPKN